MLKRLFKSVVLAVLAFVLVTSTVLAAWAYLFPITIVDTSNTTRSYYPVMLGFNGQTLVDAAKISSNGTDTNMQIGSSSIKYMMSTTNVTAVIPSLPSGGVVTTNLYTGYTPLQPGFPIITGSGGYVTTADNSTIELGDNFTIELSGWVDTSAVGTNLTSKQNAFRTYIGGSGNITSSILGQTVYLLPNGTGNYTGINSQFPNVTFHWDKVDDPVGAPDDGATYVYNSVAVQQKDAYALPDITQNIGDAIVTVYYRVYELGGFTQGFAQPYLWLNGIETPGTERNFGNVWTNYNEVLARPGGGTWTTADINNLQVVIGIRDANLDPVYCTQIYVKVDYSVMVTATSVSSSNITVKTISDGVNVWLIAGSSVSANSTTALVPDNPNNWIWASNAMPYTDNISLSVNGTPQLYYAPLIMLTGATVPDRQGNDNPGTITWGSNSGLNITYGEMTSYESYVATANITGGFTVPPSPMPTTWFAGGENASALPFYDSFSSVATQTGQPVQSLYALAIIGVAFGAFLGIVLFTRSALMAYIAMIIVFGVGATMTIIPAWIVFALIIVGAGIMYLYRQMA